MSAASTLEAVAGRRPLDRGGLTARLPPDLVSRLEDLRVEDRVDSTNERLLRGPWPARRGLRVCLAETQSAGRGRRGRRWDSPSGAGIWMSLATRYEGGRDRLTTVPLATGIAAVEVLRRHGAADAGLKWPNDLYLRGAKLGGILVESRSRGEEVLLVVGLGINVALPIADREDAGGTRTDLRTAMSGEPPERSLLAADLVAAVVAALDEQARSGFESFRDRYRRVDLLRGKVVEVTAGGRSDWGEVLGVHPSGRLLVTLAGRSGVTELCASRHSVSPMA